MSELSRLQFIEERDGLLAAVMFAQRTMRIYRRAVLASAKRGHEKPHHASFREFRPKFIRAYLELKQYLV